MIPFWLPTLAIFCAACCYFTGIGLPLARAVAPRGVATLCIAPTFGWAATTVVALPVFTLVGFGPWQTGTFALVTLLGAAAWWRYTAGPTLQPAPHDAEALPPWTLFAAALIAWLPAMAIMPKQTPTGLILAPPMFDHVKIALVDAIMRTGLPVPNPFYGPTNPGHLAYYYLWHFSAATLGSTLHCGGWAADAAMTGFTAFASLMLMTGLAATFGGGTIGMVGVSVLSLVGSMRPVLSALVGADTANTIVPRSSDIGGWLNQAAWVPQHLAAGCCAVVSALLMLRLAGSGGLLVAVCLGLTVAAGFESSVWVGGIGFGVAGLALGFWLVWRTPGPARRIFILRGGAAACLAALLILPLFIAELHAAQARGQAGLALASVQVFGTALPEFWRHMLGPPAFWLILLPFAWPAVAPLGLAGAWLRYGARTASVGTLAGLGLVSLAFLSVAWLLRSTIDNNDLGWRAGIPAMLVLTPCAAGWLAALASRKSWLLLAASCGIAATGAPDTVRMVIEYAGGQRPGAPAEFARSDALWQAVRRHTGPHDRIANNPHFIAAATPWPINISWATLSDRPSCYAGWGTVIAYTSLARPALIAINDRFNRIFDGVPTPGDVSTLSSEDNCAAAVVTEADAAWTHDPFAASTDYALAEAQSAWRIYTRKKR